MNIGSLLVEKTGDFSNVKVNKALPDGVSATGSAQSDSTVNSAVEVIFDSTVKLLLNEVSEIIQQRQALFAALPEPVEEAVREIVRQNTPGQETVANGLVSVIKAEKTVAGQIQQLAEEIMLHLDRQQLPSIISTLPEPIKRDLQAFLAKENAYPEKLKTIAESLQEIAKTYQKPAMQDAEMHGQGAMLALTVPLYLGEGNIPYPAYIHVYRQQDKEQTECIRAGQDIWLRICLSTENIGIVDVIFHLYNQSLVNVGVTFSGEEPAKFFETFIPLVRREFEGSEVTLAEIRVKAMGAENEK